MILINKDLQVQDLVLTLTELTTISTPVYLLVLTNDFDQVVTRIILSQNFSPNRNRYDLFGLQKSQVSGLTTGLYTYQVFQSSEINYDESVLGKPIESGKAKVIAPAELVQPIIYQSDDKSDYITYKSAND